MAMGEGDAKKAEEQEEEKEKKGSGGGEEAGGDLDEQGQVKPTTTNKKKGRSTADGGEGKRASPVVLRVDLHCDGCALKVKKAIKAAQGVEAVATDMAASTVTVSGKPDPWDLKERIESRAHKAVAFVSPPHPPKKKINASADASKKPAAAAAAACKGNNDGMNKTNDDKKNKEPPESTVVMKIRLHCNGCIDRIKRTARKIKGVKQVTVDTAKEHVTVKGSMDAKALPDVLRDKLKREVAVVPAKKDGDGGKKKQQGGNDDDDDKAAGDHDQQQAASSGKKKKKIKMMKQQQQEEGEELDKVSMSAAVMEQPFFPAAMMYGGGGPYRVEMLHAPQLFSDENPNACSVM